jgi:hypothetical protein
MSRIAEFVQIVRLKAGSKGGAMSRKAVWLAGLAAIGVFVLALGVASGSRGVQDSRFTVGRCGLVRLAEIVVRRPARRRLMLEAGRGRGGGGWGVRRHGRSACGRGWPLTVWVRPRHVDCSYGISDRCWRASV